MKEKNSTPDADKRILHAARELFIQKGYDGTSIRDIAAASGTNVAHIKYYFNSKYNLFEIIFDEAFDTLINKVLDTLSSDMPFFELIESWINIYYELLPQYPQIPVFILNEANRGPDALVKRLIERNPQRIFTILSDRIDEAVKEGIIKETPAIDFGLNVLSLCLFPFMFAKFATKIADKSIDEYNEMMQKHKEYVIAFVINALKN
ncbi:TetR/AcrR family transcriptional regulator [Bacteroides sp. 224]|uniref:TetR/AcrR family transcriptional regulator n=1 Tax=Bacteroides sp. 224 TaxID=2302936 RepID=UPI0013D5616C|nr:TetR/AcrR family transcriptional regulator [Bacteroides sp. 224]NDV63792.1 TetR/AcrR family transcriptional regulator [Bacteroides sp. 224]